MAVESELPGGMWKMNKGNSDKAGLSGRKTSVALVLGAGALIAGGLFVAPSVAPVLAGPLNSDKLVDPEWEGAVRKHLEKRFFNLIDATETQKTQLDELFKQRCEATRQTREQVKEGAVQVAKLMADDAATEEQIRARVAEIRKMREQLMDGRLDTALKVRALLTKEQRQIVSDRVVGFITGNQKRVLFRSIN